MVGEDGGERCGCECEETEDHRRASQSQQEAEPTRSTYLSSWWGLCGCFGKERSDGGAWWCRAEGRQRRLLACVDSRSATKPGAALARGLCRYVCRQYIRCEKDSI